MSKPIVNVENLTFRYDERFETEALSNVSFTVEKGEWVAVVGQNGSGKSTLAKLLVGLLVPQSGQVFIAGKELKADSILEIRKHIGMVFQNPDNQFIGTTVQDDIAFSLENQNMHFNEMEKRVNNALRLVGLSEYRDHDPSRLSGGQKQRVAIAGILALKPDVLVLDEAFVMLDPKSRRELLETIRELNQKEEITIISITHDMNEAAAAHKMVMMKEGKIIQCGPPNEVFSSQPELKPPFSEQLRRALLNKHRDVPSEYMTEEEMVRWLCK